MISEVKFSDIDGNPGLSFKVIEKYESNELRKRCESKYVTADLNSGKSVPSRRKTRSKISLILYQQ